jgi:hypothetical protein
MYGVIGSSAGGRQFFQFKEVVLSSEYPLSEVPLNFRSNIFGVCNKSTCSNGKLSSKNMPTVGYRSNVM